MPSPRRDGFVTGLVLGAGGSRRLGRPKQLLPYGEKTLLGHVARHRARVPVRPARRRARRRRGRRARAGRPERRRRRRQRGVRERAARHRSPRRWAPSTSAPSCSSSCSATCRASPSTTVEALVGAGAATRRSRYAATTTSVGIRLRSTVVCSKSWAIFMATRASGGCWISAPTRSWRSAIAGPVPLDVDTPEDYEAVLAAAGFVEARA